jgi:predicted DsbA family dithiol-disulfide isomerase
MRNRFLLAADQDGIRDETTESLPRRLEPQPHNRQGQKMNSTSSSQDFNSLESTASIPWHLGQLLAILYSILLFAGTLTVSAQTRDQEIVLAKVNGHKITQRDVDETVLNQILTLQQQIYAIRKIALDNLISRRIMESEALSKKVSIDQLKQEWMSGPVAVSHSQVEELYQQNASAFALMSPDEAKEKLRLDLEGQTRLKKYREALAKLRNSSKIDLFLEEPRLPPVARRNRAASNGPENARVVITEFSDFQCPYCREVQPALKRVLSEYPNDVRLDFKHMPLEIHPFAFASAQAALCGGEQGVFWQFHDALFESERLSSEIFSKLANEMNLESNRFQVCLTSPETRAAVLADLEEARRLGINGTPSFIVNGKQLRGAVSFEVLKASIERELKNAQSGSHEQ